MDENFSPFMQMEIENLFSKKSGYNRINSKNDL
jgi:hypothetical protein